MPRSKWKTPFIDPTLLDLLASHHRAIDDIHHQDPHNLMLSDKKKRRRAIKTMTSARATIITHSFCGLTLQVHNGTKYLPIKIVPEHVGKKLGEFSYTRKIMKHKELKKKKVPGKK